MNAEEEFERIRKLYENNEKIELIDVGILLQIITLMNKRAKQDKHNLNSLFGYQATDSIHKVQLSSLYGKQIEIYKNVDISIDTSNGYFKDENVDIKITDKFIIIRNKEYQRFYNINEIEYFSIKESEVK